MKTTAFSKTMITMYSAHWPTQAPHCRGSPAGRVGARSRSSEWDPGWRCPAPPPTALAHARTPTLKLLNEPPKHQEPPLPGQTNVGVLNKTGEFLIWR